jgi:hypothetical protein
MKINTNIALTRAANRCGQTFIASRNGNVSDTETRFITATAV